VATPVIDSTNELVSSDVLTTTNTIADRPAGPSLSLNAIHFSQLFVAPQVIADQHVSHQSSTLTDSIDSTPATPNLPKTAVDWALFSASMFRSRHALGGHTAPAADVVADLFADWA
jgi:hypothetical protein